LEVIDNLAIFSSEHNQKYIENGYAIIVVTAFVVISVIHIFTSFYGFMGKSDRKTKKVKLPVEFMK